MVQQPLVTILMATYNGGAFLTDQLESIAQQSYRNWRLWIRDDGSTDNTPAILDDFRARFDRVRVFRNPEQRRGACPNFAALLEMARRDEDIRYVLFCDQDDIWKPDKVAISLERILEMEQTFPGQPVLIYGNVELMDATGRQMAGELKLRRQLELRTLLSYNYALGCTMLLNRALVSAVGGIPAVAVNHDYWIALVASMYAAAYVEDKLVRYRQHGHNASGNVAGNSSFMARMRRHIIRPGSEIASVRARLEMLREFQSNYGQQLDPQSRTMLSRYLAAYRSNRLSVCYLMLRYRILKTGFLQSLASFYQVLAFFHQIKTKTKDS